MSVKKTNFDVIVIGCGPAGMTAALYTSRSNLDTLILERGVPGGELLSTADIENYPGFSKITGPDLADNMYESAMQFGAEYAYGTVKQITPQDGQHVVETDNGTYTAKAVILATGATQKHLNVPGEEEYAGRGVSYCAVCDGAFFKGKKLKVIGGGDSAVEEGTYLTQFAEEVAIIHRRDTLRAQEILQERARANEKVSFLWNRNVNEILGDGQQVTGVLTVDKAGQEETFPANGVFIYIGLSPNTQGLEGLGITDDEGWLITNELMQTAVPGIFACGDVRQKRLRQISTAVGDGSLAGQMAYQYLNQ